MSRALRVTRRGRRRAEALMVDTCRIRPVLDTEYDPDTMRDVPVYGDPVYEGMCKVQRYSGVAPGNPAAGEHRWTVAQLQLHLPVSGSELVELDQLAEITASVDPANVGRRFRIRDGDRKSLQTAVRFAVEEVTG